VTRLTRSERVKQMKDSPSLELPLEIPEPRESPDEPSSMPRYVRVGSDRRGALLFFDHRSRRWRASNGAGPLNVDGYDSFAAAHEAIRKAPALPKPQGKLTARKLPPSAHADDLTGDERRVFDAKGKRIGAVWQVDGVDRYGAFGLNGKLGEFPTVAEAEKAVRAAQGPK
jgi:hypothetical protein